MNKKPAPIALTQLEDALEERQKPDRRQTEVTIPEGVIEDRRRDDRRTKKNKG